LRAQCEGLSLVIGNLAKVTSSISTDSWNRMLSK